MKDRYTCARGDLMGDGQLAGRGRTIEKYELHCVTIEGLKRTAAALPFLLRDATIQ
jgi:hypothetical protein